MNEPTPDDLAPTMAQCDAGEVDALTDCLNYLEDAALKVGLHLAARFIELAAEAAQMEFQPTAEEIAKSKTHKKKRKASNSESNGRRKQGYRQYNNSCRSRCSKKITKRKNKIKKFQKLYI